MNLPDPLDRHALAELARDVAEQAGRLIVQGRPDRLEVSSKSSRRDIVTEMDQRAQDALCEALAAARPDDAILGEEQGGRPGTSGLTWVLDPIDGTVNYLYGLSPFSVSVAVVEGDPTTWGRWSPLAGAVVIPPVGLTYLATLGGGAMVQDAHGAREVRASSAAELSMALVATGFAYGAELRCVQTRAFVEIIPKVRDIRRTGSAAADLCWVADGRLDGYFEAGLHAWDVAAGQLIATEAGAVLHGLGDEVPNGDLYAMSAPGISADFAALLRSAHRSS